MPNEQSKKTKPRLNLSLKPISDKEARVNENLLNRLLGGMDIDDTPSPNKPVQDTNQSSIQTSASNIPLRYTDQFEEQTGVNNTPILTETSTTQTTPANEPVRTTDQFDKQTSVDNEPVRNTTEPEIQTSASNKPLRYADQYSEQTGIPNKPLRHSHPFAHQTGVNDAPVFTETSTTQFTQTNEPVRITNQPNKQTGAENIPLHHPDRFEEHTRSQNKQVRHDRVAPNTPVQKPAVSVNKPIRETPRSKDERSQGYIKLTNEVLDKIFPILTPFEQAVYLRLYRLSHGFNKDICTVGMTSLTKAANVRETACRSALRRLIALNLIEIVEVLNNREIKGTTYRVYTSLSTEPVQRANPSEYKTSFSDKPITDHDHDDLKTHDHHQNKIEETYSKLTGKAWTKADQRAYQQINHIAEEQIIAEMRAIAERSTSPIGSFAYFATSIKNALVSGKGNLHIRKRLEQIVVQLCQAHVGGNYSISDLAEDLKNACVREGIEYTPDLINEIINRH